MNKYSQNDPKIQPYLLCDYLEKLNDNKKGVPYQKRKKMFSFTTKVLCIDLFSLNQITTKKKSYFFYEKQQIH